MGILELEGMYFPILNSSGPGIQTYIQSRVHMSSLIKHLTKERVGATLCSPVGSTYDGAVHMGKDVISIWASSIQCMSYLQTILPGEI